MTDRSVPSRTSWGARVIVVVWGVACTLVLVWLMAGRTAPPPAVPSADGWTHWPGLGSVRALAVKHDGTVLAGGVQGLFRVPPGGEPEAIASGSDTIIHTLLWEPPDRLWIGREDGLTLHDGGRWRTVEGPDAAVRSLLRTGDGLWVGMDGGAVLLDGLEVTRSIEAGDGLPSGGVWAMLEDGAAIWFGTYGTRGAGLARLASGSWRTWGVEDGLPHSYVTSLLRDADDRIWVGTGFFDRGGAALLARSPRSGSWRVTAMLGEGELAGPKVRSLFSDAAGRLWLGSEQSGLAVREPAGRALVLTTADGLPSQEILTMTGGTDGAVWLGTTAGLLRLSAEAIEDLFRNTGEERAR